MNVVRQAAERFPDSLASDVYLSISAELTSTFLIAADVTH